MSWHDIFSAIGQGYYFEHHGVGKLDTPPPPGRGSGRYELGSGERSYQRSSDLYARYIKLKRQGMTQAEIARAFGFYKTDRKGNVILDEDGLPVGNGRLVRSRLQNVARNEVRYHNIKEAQRLAGEIDPDTGKPYTNTKIGELLGGYGEASVRNWLSKDPEEGKPKAVKVADELRDFIADGNYADVGRGIERTLGTSREGLNSAIEILKDEGYEVHNIQVTQLGGDGSQKTTVKVLCPPDTEWKEVMNHTERIKYLDDPGGDSVLTSLGMRIPVQVSRDRIKVVYDEDGGTLKDGMIEIRAVKDKDGVLHAASPDLDLGNAKYAQVRIAVEGEKYIKGMAVYNPDLPKGTDILVNSNKSVKEPEKAFKNMKELKDKDGNVIGVDWDNPFGSTVYQEEYGDGKLSAINVVSDIRGVDKHQEGAWENWSRNLPSQFLGKQSDTIVQQQLKLKHLEKKRELEEILNLNNPVVKQQMLLDFAEGCDAAAADLKAAPFPGQRTAVLLAGKTVKETEVYCPQYENGTTLALVRFPHTGPFEIPIVKVNNNNKESKAFLEDSKGQSRDAIVVHHNTAEILSGADHDGDTVTVIPMTRKNSQGEFEKVVNIQGIGNGYSRLPDMDEDLHKKYKIKDDSTPRMTERQKQTEMGVASNLMTDMMIKGCTDPYEQARAVKYTMVVIDAVKHELDYKQAEKDYEIKELKKKYQNGGGASTLLSLASAEYRAPERDRSRGVDYDIDPKTGEKIYRETGRTYEKREKVKVPAPEGYRYIDPKDGISKKSKWLRDENGKFVYETYPNGKPVKEGTGKIVEAKTKTTMMDKVKDARELLSDHPSNKEIMYADFANQMKAMANESRKEYLAVSKELDKYKIDPEAKKKYVKEVESLQNKLETAKANAPRERQAQLVGNQIVKARVDDNPNMDNEEYAKVKGQALLSARDRTGANKVKVTFTDEEWEAVNARAIGKTTLRELLKNSKAEHYKEMATPRQSRISDALAAQIKAMLKNGWTAQQIADAGIAGMETINKVKSGGY